MSVVVTIKRREASPLSRSEIELALGNSPSFARDEGGGWRLLSGSPETELFLNVEEDEAWTDGSREWLESAALDELRALAAVLEARVFGEEGEDITVAHPAASDPPIKKVGKPLAALAAIFGILLIPVLIVVAVLRLPWVLWRVTRQK